MRKLYLLLLLLFPVATIVLPSRAFAADPPKADYDRAMEAFTDGLYYITTTTEAGIKYYVTMDGGLTDLQAEAHLFTIKKDAGGALYDIGLFIDAGTGQYFTNTNLEDSKAILNFGSYRMSDANGHRHDWESQVPFMNEEGLIAIRSCNTAYGESSWADAGRTFWSYELGDFDITPCYSYDPAYVWKFEVPTDLTLILGILNGIYDTYSDYAYDDGAGLNIGTGFGQHSALDTYEEFKEKVLHAEEVLYQVQEGEDVIDLAGAEALKAEIDSLYQVIMDSEVPYMMPQDGYYRIIAHNRYKSTFSEEGFVDKAIAASFEKEHADKAVYGTLRRDRANYLWKFTKSETGDSILIQNAGMGTYISITSGNPTNKVFMTADPAEARYVMFDYAAFDYVEPDGNGVEKDIFAIRLAANPRDHESQKYVHQMSHGSASDQTSPWGTYGTDTGVDQELGFWRRTFDYDLTRSDAWASEWYLEYVEDEEAEEIIANFEMIKNHDVLVAQNNELRAKVLETLTLAKDVIKTKLITSASQMSSPYSHNDQAGNGRDGGDLSAGVLIDGDASTYWHSAYANSPEGQHYIQLTGMENMVGDCEFYLRERAGAANDRPKKFQILGTDNLKNEDFEWVEMAIIDIPNFAAGAESTVPFYIETPYPYVRVVGIDCDPSYRTFWHAAELQILTVRDNPNSQFAQLGEVAETLQQTYEDNVATPDEEITLAIYEALLNAYNTFLASGLVDPAELRAALAAYAKVTEGVVEGTNPGQWANAQVAEDYNKLYAEVDAYEKSGKWNAEQIHKYTVMLKAMQKSVMEKANGIETDKWYRIMYPTEEMFDAYGFGKEGGDKTSLREDQPNLWGTFVTVAKEFTEQVPNPTDEDPDAVKDEVHLEVVSKDDTREDTRLFFMSDDEIEDMDLSEFRFIEREADATDYTPLFKDVKENMLMALDMSTTYTKGEGLITSAAQLSSNSLDRSEGNRLEYLVDGLPSTYWHSDYHKDVLAAPYLQVAFNEPISGFIQVEIARRNTTNGHITRMYVQGSNDAAEWTNIGYIETPFTDVNTPSSSQPFELGGAYSYLRFTLTSRYGTDAGGNMEFDPFVEVASADDYNKTWTYCHASEFQIYPLTADKALSASGQALQQAYTAANKVLLKDVTAEDLAAAAQGYKAFKDEFNAAEGKDVLPSGADKAPSSYAIQNKATGLFVFVDGTGNQNNVYLRTVPTLYTYKALSYERSLLSGRNLKNESTNNMHAGESNRRFCTWGSTEATSNSGLVICEADDEYVAPEEFTFIRDIKPGKINAWCSSVTLTGKGEGVAYTCLGSYTDDEGQQFLALKEIETIPAGQPAFYIYDDTLNYDAEDDYVEPMEFTIPGEQEFVVEGDTINGLIGSLVNHTLPAHEIYFSGNHAVCIGKTGYYLTGPCVALDMVSCPVIDPDGVYDFSILLGGAADEADGIDVATAVEKISQRGNVYSMDGKLLRTNATLNSLKTLGKGMYILNGVKVAVK